ncbi:hypothetical protein GMDG_01566 [Pseudogymnoascus destructans 20631-21]|uniref:Uncharacterized protein n=2 Tax=Pseudogymnoascus destructans TaxID=655981 RepID=L8FVK0_PSED2|nr:hypothetical protein GMDG_01566 [Pseudogymnoascus destructans 20631-21]
MLREAAEANTALSKKRHQSHTDDPSKNPGTTYPGYHNCHIAAEMEQYGNRISAREAEDKWTEISEQIDREAHFLLLLHMRHDLLDIKEDVLEKVLPEYQSSQQYMGMSVLSLWKRSNITASRQDCNECNRWIWYSFCTTLDGLGDMFRTRYTAANFFEAFRFIHHYIDLEKSSNLAQYYVKELYVNACARTKLMMDWKSDPNRKAVSLHSRESFTDFLQCFPLIADYDQLDKDEFHETFKRRSNTKAPKPILKKHALIQGQEYILSRASPLLPKCRKETLVPGRSARAIE